MKRKILIVDKDESFVRGLKYSLKEEYIIEVEDSGKNILDKIDKKEYNLILLDLLLPDTNGLKLCKSIRNNSQVPIIIITEKDEDFNKILALEYGADDYLVKPFNVLELKARIKALLRRVEYGNRENNEKNGQIAQIGEFKINTLGRKINIHNRQIDLTCKEFDLFYVLVSNPGRIFKREKLLELVWGYAYYGDLRTVDVHIRRIREKLEEDSSNAEYILTKWGVGYYYNGSHV